MESASAPRPGRLGPRKAAELAAGAQLAGAPRGSARTILELLLRHQRGPIAIERRTSWIADQVGVSKRTARRALHALVAAGVLSVVVPGGGRTCSQYRVDVDRLSALTGVDLAPRALSSVHSGESAGKSTVHSGESDGESTEIDDPPGGTLRPPRGDITTPLGGHYDPPGVTLRPPPTRARASAPGSLLPLHSKSPLPPPGTAAPPGQDPSPVDDGAPFQEPKDFRETGDIDQRCPHGRTVAQGGCRACGTTPRQLASTQGQQDRSRALEQQRKATAAKQAAEAELRAASTPPPPDLRANIRKSRSP